MNAIDLIRKKINLREVVREYTQLKKRGPKYVGLCPFHKETVPSFTVDEAKQLYHCFGCGEGGDIFSFVMKAECLIFKNAVKYLAKRLEAK